MWTMSESDAEEQATDPEDSSENGITGGRRKLKQRKTRKIRKQRKTRKQKSNRKSRRARRRN